MRLAVLALLATLASPASAACRQALALGLDVSGSVDADEYRQQVEGLAAALTSVEVRDILLGQPEAPVRITVYEWSGPQGQVTILPWTELADAAALEAAAAQVAGAVRREADLTTALGAALRTGFELLDQQDDCWRRTLDLSGDGLSNTGPRPQDVPQSETPAGVTVNALVIGTAAVAGDDRNADIKELAGYFRTLVIRGPGAFAETALGYGDYEAAMTRKLIRELASLAIGEAG